MTAAYSGILHVNKESSRPTLIDDTITLNMELPMSSSGYNLFFFNPVTRVRTQGKHSSSGTFRVFRVPPVHPFPTQIQLTNKHLIKHTIYIFFLLTCANYLNSNKHLIKNTIYIFFLFQFQRFQNLKRVFASLD